jgi:hypothetical protein
MQCERTLMPWSLRSWLAPVLALACSEPHYLIGDDRALAGTDSMAGADGQGEGGCPPACTRGCAGQLCEIDPLPDGTLPECPAAFDCTVHCEQPGACLGPVRCGQASHCLVNCSGQDNCTGLISCDSADTCTVTCSGTRACAAIDCGSARDCAVSCTGTDSCSAGIACGAEAGVCGVLCRGEGSCAGKLSCAGSCGCDWQCELGSACVEPGPACPGGCETSAGCSSTAPGCRTCP